MTAPERSRDELHGILILVGRQIRKLNLGRKDTPILKQLRRAPRDAGGGRCRKGRKPEEARLALCFRGAPCLGLRAGRPARGRALLSHALP